MGKLLRLPAIDRLRGAGRRRDPAVAAGEAAAPGHRTGRRAAGAAAQCARRMASGDALHAAAPGMAR